MARSRPISWRFGDSSCSDVSKGIQDCDESTNLEHNLDAPPANLVGDLLQLSVSAVSPTEAGADELRAVGNEKVPNTLLGNSRDLNEFGEAIAHLSFRESLEEGEVEEGNKRGVVCSQPAAVMILCQIALPKHVIEEVVTGS
jgi:hypothetical protein